MQGLEKPCGCGMGWYSRVDENRGALNRVIRGQELLTLHIADFLY